MPLLVLGAKVFDFFKKNKKNIQSSVILDYHDDGLYVKANPLSPKSIQEFIHYVQDSIISEGLGELKENVLYLSPENFYYLEAEQLQILNIPTLFVGNAKLIMKGHINQGNVVFSCEFFSKKNEQIYGEHILGNFLKISSNEIYLLPQNIFLLLKLINQAKSQSEYDAYKLIEYVQNDSNGNIIFDAFSKNDYIETVGKIRLDIEEDADNNLILHPRISDLSREQANKYQALISTKKDSLLLTEVDPKTKKIKRYALDEQKLCIVENIQKRRKIPKESAPFFLSNPESFLIDDEMPEAIKEELREIIDGGWRIVGIGKPYFGYFGSKKEAPLSEVLKNDIEIISNEPSSETIASFSVLNDEELVQLQKNILESIEKKEPELSFGGQKIKDSEFQAVLKHAKAILRERAKNSGKIIVEDKDGLVLLIKPNDEDFINNSQMKVLKNLSTIETENHNKGTLYKNFTEQRQPFPHQVKALNWLIDLYKNEFPGCLLADDMGLGKTYQVISFLDYISNQKNSKTLIVAPTVLIDNWNKEFQESLLSLEKHNIKVIRGEDKTLKLFDEIFQGKQSEQAIVNNIQAINFLEDYNVYITTYTTLQRYQFGWAYFCHNKGIDCIVYDEAQNIKNPNALQTQAAKAVSSMCKFNILLTGTPIENELRDLWCIFDVFDPSFFGSWKNFRKEYVSESDDIEKKLREKISNYMLRRLKKDIIENLPKKFEPRLDINHACHKSPIEISMSREEHEQYKLILQEKTASLAKLRKLRYFSLHPLLTEGAVSLEKMSDDSIFLKFSKAKALIEILDSIHKKEQKVIIFVISKTMQSILQMQLAKKYGIKVNLINGDNNKGEALSSKLNEFKGEKGFAIIILSPLAAGVGLTINEANHVIHYERHWNPSKEDQASDRVYRIGQKENVYIYHLISKLPDGKKSFDDGLHQLIMKKKSLSDGTLIPTVSVSESELSEAIFDEINDQKLENLSSLTPIEFENYVKNIFSSIGYRCILTDKYPSEYGADVIARKDNEVIAIQCKHSSVNAKFDAEAIRQLHTEARPYYQATRLIAITNTYFNMNAKNLAKIHDIEIIDKDNNIFNLERT
ncbi:MAG: hypothetical protein EOM50_12540 [Erysipelotrichia bacterium]|nr:hypothetical protein [Erysipelotrichia bacterium]